MFLYNLYVEISSVIIDKHQRYKEKFKMFGNASIGNFIRLKSFKDFGIITANFHWAFTIYQVLGQAVSCFTLSHLTLEATLWDRCYNYYCNCRVEEICSEKVSIFLKVCWATSSRAGVWS